MSNIPKGYKQTEIGVIPSDWEVKDIGDVVSISVGRDLIEEIFSYNKDYIFKYPVYSNTVSNQGLYGFYKSPEYNGNSLTVVGRGVGLGTAFKRVGGFGAIGRLLVLFPNKNTDPNYLAEYINHKVTIFFENSGIPQLTGVSFAKYQVVLPTAKAEQTTIAIALNDADALIIQLEKLIAKKRNIKQGTMQELLTGRKRLPGFEKKKGYKQTEIGVIPSDWELVSYGKVFDFLITATYSRSQLSEAGEIKYVHYGDIHTKCQHFLDCDKIELPSIRQELLNNYPMLKEGDVIVVDASEDYEGVGKSVEVRNIGEFKIISGLHTFLLRDKNDLIANSFKGYIHSNKLVKKQMDTLATGMKVYGVSKTNMKLIKIPLPPIKAEQTAIAQILSDMDTEIEALEKKLEKYKMIKQGMMQNLLTGRIRLV